MHITDLTDNLITADFSTAWDGMFYAVNVQRRIGPDDSVDQIYILLEKSHIYNIFVHDPAYFIPSFKRRIFLEVDSLEADIQLRAVSRQMKDIERRRIKD